MSMPMHKIVPQDEWLAARKSFLAAEKEFTRARDQLSRQRRELPWVKVDKSYVFDGPNGRQTLADLFDGRPVIGILNTWSELTPCNAHLHDLAQRVKQHAKDRGITPGQFALAWVLNNRLVTSTIAGPRTLEQWEDYIPALKFAFGEEDEAFVDGLVVSGHSSTPGYNDPSHPFFGRQPRHAGQQLAVHPQRQPPPAPLRCPQRRFRTRRRTSRGKRASRQKRGRLRPARRDRSRRPWRSRRRRAQRRRRPRTDCGRNRSGP